MAETEAETVVEAEPVVEATAVPEDVVPDPSPAPKKRGRPPGAKNKPKIAVVPLETAPATPPAPPPEPVAPVAKTPKPKKTARVEEPPPTPPATQMPYIPQVQQTPALTHETVRMLAHSLSEFARSQQESRRDRFMRMVATRVTTR